MTTDTLTDVAEVERIPHPTTGEAIAIVATTPSDVLADVRDRLVEQVAVANGWKRSIDAELTRRLDYEGTRSAEVDGAAGRFKLTGKAPTKTVWDGDEAHRALRRLVRAGLISKERAAACVERVVTYKPRHGELAKLLKHADDRVRDAVAACASETEQDRSVSVSRVHAAQQR